MNAGRVEVSVRAVLAGICLASALLPAVAGAGTLSMAVAPQAATTYWTAERYRDAKPLPLAQGIEDAAIADALANETAEAAAAPAKSFEAPGGAPLAGLRAGLQTRLFDPADADWSAATEEDSMAEPASASGAFFTSARLVPQTADLTYPYTTIGRLYFSIGSNNFYCSAAVIRPRLIATAAQCVHAGKASPGFYSNFQFAPAYRNAVSPLGLWNGVFIVAHTNWTNGGGGLPNSADYALIELQDRVISGVTRKVGDVTGFLGYITQKIRPNHAHLIGYASNFDAGGRMHQVTAQAFRAASQNNAEYGSDMRDGSAGGGIIQDFGDNPATVKWIGAISYFYNATATKLQGAATPDSKFTAMLTAACAHKAGNC